MPIINTYYINGVDLQSSTAVFLDAALSICAPDGYYSDGSIVRKQISCVLASNTSCPNCCNDTCSLWNFKTILGSFTVSYIDCTTGEPTEVTYPDPTDEDVCVAYGTTPTLVSGDADFTLLNECGCCYGSNCTSWLLQTQLGDYAAFFYYDCDGFPVTVSLGQDQTLEVCATDGFKPQLIAGVGTIEFSGCGC